MNPHTKSAYHTAPTYGVTKASGSTECVPVQSV